MLNFVKTWWNKPITYGAVAATSIISMALTGVMIGVMTAAWKVESAKLAKNAKQKQTEANVEEDETV